jgi:hypothetical protein
VKPFSNKASRLVRLAALLTALLAALLTAQGALAGPLHKVVGKDGKVTVTDQAPPAASASAQADSGAGSKPTGQLAEAYTKQIIVESAARFCLREVPASSAALTAARDAWRDRNGEINDKRNRIMQAIMTSDERNKLAGGLQRENDLYLSKMRAAPAAEKTAWCERAPASFKSQELDILQNAGLVKTIMDYPIPRQ